MTALRNDLIQSAIVAYLKTKTTITSELSSSSEIREDQWQGTEFSYPNVRVRMISNVPESDTECNRAKITLGIQVFSQEASSYQADKISGIISQVLHGHPFASQSLNFSFRASNIIPAIRSDMRTWRSEVMLSGIVSG